MTKRITLQADDYIVKSLLEKAEEKEGFTNPVVKIRWGNEGAVELEVIETKEGIPELEKKLKKIQEGIESLKQIGIPDRILIAYLVAEYHIPKGLAIKTIEGMRDSFAEFDK